MLKEIIGTACALSLWAIYLGLWGQWRKVWRNNVSPSFPKLIAGISFSNYVTYVAWGLAMTPPDNYRIAAFCPGMVLMPVLWLQYHNPRPAPGVTLRRVLVALGCAAVYVAVLVGHRGILATHVTAIAFVTTALSVSYSVVGIPRQILEIRRCGTAGSSVAFNVVIFAGFVLWWYYGMLTHDVFLLVSQSVGLLLQGVVLWLHWK